MATHPQQGGVGVPSQWYQTTRWRGVTREKVALDQSLWLRYYVTLWRTRRRAKKDVRLNDVSKTPPFLRDGIEIEKTRP